MNGTRTQPGGGALYAAIAAKALNAKTAIITTVGKDFSFTNCFDGLDSTGIKTFNMPSTRFYIRYNRNWEAKYIEAHAGAGARITSSQIPSRLLKPQSLIHLSPMKPAKVTKIINNIKQRSSDVKVSISTWIGYTKEPRNRRLLKKLASQADFFMLNEFEAKALTQSSSLSLALERMKAQRLIVTMGKLGAIVSGSEIEPQMIPALSDRCFNNLKHKMLTMGIQILTETDFSKTLRCG